jgi:hypothetical protein
MTIEELRILITGSNFNVTPYNLTPIYVYKFTTDTLLKIGEMPNLIIWNELTYNFLPSTENDDIYLETQTVQLSGELLIVNIVPNVTPLTIELLRQNRTLFATIVKR